MNKFALATLAVAVILTPTLARAQTSPNAEVRPLPEAQMQQIHQRMMQLHQQARTAALAALTPAHRVLLGQVVGRLATDPNADLAGAARTLDSALTPAESQAVLRIASNLHAQARQMMQSAFEQMPNRSSGQNGPEGHLKQHEMSGANSAWKTDAGYVLLHMSMPHAGPGFHM